MNVGIDHGGGQVRMAEHLLNQADLARLTVEVRCKRVANQSSGFSTPESRGAIGLPVYGINSREEDQPHHCLVLPMSRFFRDCGILVKPINRENPCMDKHFRTLKEIEAKVKGVSYQKLNRASNALVEAELIHPWRGANNERRFSLDDALRIERFIGLLSNGQTMKTAVEELRSIILEERVEQLEKENKELRALVEVRQDHWWMRLFCWFRIARVHAVSANLHR